MKNEFDEVVSSLVPYMIKNRKKVLNQSNYETFNNWQQNGVMACSKEEIQWCLEFIENMKKKQLKNEELLSKLFCCERGGRKQ